MLSLSALKKKRGALPIVEPGEAQNSQKFFGSFFQKRTAFLLLPSGLLHRKGGSQ
jgi:hypothetical protein